MGAEHACLESRVCHAGTGEQAPAKRPVPNTGHEATSAIENKHRLCHQKFSSAFLVSVVQIFVPLFLVSIV